MQEEREELTRLRKENRELRIERDLLKKVHGYSWGRILTLTRKRRAHVATAVPVGEDPATWPRR